MHYRGRGCLPRRGAAAFEGLDLNSQAMDITDTMSPSDILRSSPASLFMEGNSAGSARGAGRGTRWSWRWPVAGPTLGHGPGSSTLFPLGSYN